MTTPWTITPDCAGRTIAVLASGPSMNQALADSLRGHFTIAVKYACRLAPWADMLVALDGRWPDELRAFAGIRVTGVLEDDLDARYAGPFYETVNLSPSHQVDVRNSGLAALRIAGALGASRILLAGFDPEVPDRFYDAGSGPYVGLAEGLAKITAELRERGVVVEPAVLPSASFMSARRGARRSARHG